MKTEQDLLTNIARFLEFERDVFGPFSLPETAAEARDQQDETPAVNEETTPYLASGPKDKAADPEKREAATEPITPEDKLNACNTLEELYQLCNETPELKTDLENTNLVFGVGNPRADLMIIGEAPGEQEDKQGEPFVGAAGQLLDKILTAINFNREDVYIANILKHRPPGNRNPTPEERLRSLPYLLRQIDLIQPKIILCVGKISGTTLLKKEDTLRNLRGAFYPYRGAELTVTYHPAALLRNPQWKRPVWEDVQKVRKRYDELGCKP